MQLTYAERLFVIWLISNCTVNKSDAILIKRIKHCLNITPSTPPMVANAERDILFVGNESLNAADAEWLLTKINQAFDKEIVPGNISEIGLDLCARLEAYPS